MAISTMLHDPVNQEKEIAVDGEVVGQTEGLIYKDQFICMYTTSILSSVGQEVTWTFLGYYDTYDAAFASILTTTSITGVRIVKCKLPVYYLPPMAGDI